jgi:phospholipid/cholesterol/gamma-HCH transport system ATP-binding protein
MAERTNDAHITVEDLTVAYGDFVIMHDMNFTVRHGDVFVIMGASGSGKSTLLRNMIGLNEPTKGDVKYDGESFTHADEPTRQRCCSASASCTRAVRSSAR